MSLHRLGLYEEAEKFYARALKLNQTSWEAWYNLGIVQMKQRRHAEAVQSFEKSLVINPGNKDAFNNAGTCYMSLRNYSQAVKCYERAMALDPNFFTLHLIWAGRILMPAIVRCHVSIFRWQRGWQGRVAEHRLWLINISGMSGNLSEALSSLRQFFAFFRENSEFKQACFLGKIFY